MSHDAPCRSARRPAFRPTTIERRVVRRALGAVALGVAALAAGGAAAQVVTDGSLGAATSLDGPLVRVDPALGRQAGANLFHSLARLDARAGQVVVFGAAPGTTNVVARVTGGGASAIDGALDADAGAALWVINPAGIDLGPGAQLRASGGTFLSAGDTLIFDDGVTFSADPAAGLTLSAAAPAAFGFIDVAPGRLTADRTTLRARGRGLTLAGGEVSLNGIDGLGVNVGAITLLAGGRGDALPASGAPDAPPTGGALTISGGQIINVGAAAAGGSLSLAGDAITLSDGAQVGTLTVGAAGGAAGGAVAVAGGDILITRGAALRSQTQGDGDSGPIDVAGFRTLTIERDGATASTGIESDVVDGAAGAAGRVTVSGDRALVRQDGRIFSSTRGIGDAGAVTLSVGDVRLESGGQIGAGALDPEGGLGAATGAAGRVSITAENSVVVTGVGLQVVQGTDQPQPSGVFSTSESISPAAGPAGAVFVAAPRILVDDVGEISSETFNPAPAGAIVLRPGLSLTVDRGAEIASRTGPGPVNGPGGGDGGRIDIATTGVVRVGADAEIATTVETGAGRAGEIVLQAGRIEIAGGAVSSDTADGGAGAVRLTAADIALVDGGALTTITRGVGPGGRIEIDAGALRLDAPARIATDSLAAGDGGDVILRAQAVTLGGPGARITAESAPTTAGASGAAGDIRLAVGDLTLSGGADVSTASARSAGGAIAVDAAGLALLDGGALTTSVAAGGGDGGDIGVDAGFLVLRNGGIIRANAIAGDGGDISLSAQAVVTEPGSVIEAVSVSGDDGAISVIGAATAPTAELNPPPTDFFDSFALIDDSCVAAVEGGSALTLEGPQAASLGARAVPGLFGGAIPYPVAAPPTALRAAAGRLIPCGAP